MRNQWFIWVLVAAVGVFVLFIFNYQRKADSVALTEIFPDQSKDQDVEYEFVDSKKEAVPAQVSVAVNPQPAVKATPQVAQVPSQTVSPTQTVPAESSTNTPSLASAAQANVSVTTVAKKNAGPKKIDFGKVESNAEPRIESKSRTSSRVANIPSTVSKSSNLSSRKNVSYTIQVASYNDRQSAEVALRGFQATGQQAYIGTRDLGAKGTKYRIYIGQYQTKSEANEKLSELKPKYQGSFVIAPAN